MKFREEADLTAKVITANTSCELEDKINELDELYDLIDLQYSTTGSLADIEYSALALVRKKNS